MLEIVGQKTATARTVQALFEPQHWLLGDVADVKALIPDVRSIVQKMSDQSAEHQRRIPMLRSLQLKAEAKQEETARFIRARSDPEFAQLVRVRQLGPEQAESQTQMRKKVAELSERAVELEEHLNLLRAQLNNERNHRSTFRSPSLDSINRATRNINARATEALLEMEELTLAFSMAGLDRTDSADALNLERSATPHATSRLSELGATSAISGSQSASIAFTRRCAASSIEAAFADVSPTPLLTQVHAKPTPARSNYSSGDLQMSFARLNASIAVGQRPSAPVATTLPVPPAASSEKQPQPEIALSSFKPFEKEAIHFEDDSFAPGSRESTNVSRARTAKSSKLRTTSAVALPGSDGGAGEAMARPLSFSFGPPPPTSSSGLFASLKAPLAETASVLGGSTSAPRHSSPIPEGITAPAPFAPASSTASPFSFGLPSTSGAPRASVSKPNFAFGQSAKAKTHEDSKPEGGFGSSAPAYDPEQSKSQVFRPQAPPTDSGSTFTGFSIRAGPQPTLKSTRPAASSPLSSRSSIFQAAAHADDAEGEDSTSESESANGDQNDHSEDSEDADGTEEEADQEHDDEGDENHSHGDDRYSDYEAEEAEEEEEEEEEAEGEEEAEAEAEEEEEEAEEEEEEEDLGSEDEGLETIGEEGEEE